MFTHLHNHSEYSLLDGMITPKALAERAAELGQAAIALTDHGNMSGAVEFYQACVDVGIKPILGCEIYLEPESEKRTQHTHHQTLLAASEEGYRNLIKLVSYGYLDGFYYKPRIPEQLIFENNKGIICLSGCAQSQINSYFRAGNSSKARVKAEQYKEVFGDRYFIEIHDHNPADQNIAKLRPALIDLASRTGIPLVAANDVHFLLRSDHAAHEALVCIGTGKKLADLDRLEYSTELYLKSEAEMNVVFSDVPYALSNTELVAEMCDYKMQFGKTRYPKYQLPDKRSAEAYLCDLCFDGLRNRYSEISTEHVKRLEYELKVIEDTGFVDYFLIVWDFIYYAKHNRIPVGAGRGSAAGSLVSYTLGITDVDPIRFGLIFERFLNPDRVSPPDIDIDFCMERRGEIIEYVRQKYGDRCVSQIITFNTLGARSSVRDVGRVLDAPLANVDFLAKLIPKDIGITLQQAESVSEIQQLLNDDAVMREVWQAAKKLEGIKKHAGVHAAGIVISDRPLSEYVPMALSKEKETISQYPMNPLGDLGLLKMDFLGLKTLTVISKTVDLIDRQAIGFDLDNIPLDDQQAFDIYNRGETLGIFQMESRGITGVCKKLGVNSIDDIVAIGALFRPGPMQFIDEYIMRKRGYKPVEYAHPLLEKVCADTYGIMIYQEQVQQAANLLAGYSLGEADLLRRAMGKKKASEMKKERSRFVKGCKRVNDIQPEKANEIFDWISAFAQYGFNKSHSAAYGWISYQTAYLKAHYPTEFMSAMLSHDAQDVERLSEIIYDCRRMGIKVYAPDIHSSGLSFLPVNGGIRYGLTSIKSVCAPAVESIMDARKGRKFSGLFDLCSRIDLRACNKTALEHLIMGGACDSFGMSRAQMVASLELIMKRARIHQKKLSSLQLDLFNMAIVDSPALLSENKDEWGTDEKLRHEKEVLGFFCSGHPLEGHSNNSNLTSIVDALASEEFEFERRLMGVVLKCERRTRKSDNVPFAIVTIEDFTGQLELLVWNKTFTEQKEFFVEGNVIAVVAKLRRDDEGVRAMLNKVSAPKRRL